MNQPIEGLTIALVRIEMEKLVIVDEAKEIGTTTSSTLKEIDARTNHVAHIIIIFHMDLFSLF